MFKVKVSVEKCSSAQNNPCRRYREGINNRTDIENANRRAFQTYLRRVLQPMHVSCFLANFIMPPVEGVDMEIDLV